MASEKDDQQRSLTDIVESSELNNIYFNGFGIGVSKNDIIILLKRNGKEEAILNASHITAKSLARALNRAVKEYEDDTHQKILISDEIEKSVEVQDDTTP